MGRVTKLYRKAYLDCIVCNVNIENDVLFQKVTQAYSEKKSECSYQESNLRPSDY